MVKFEFTVSDIDAENIMGLFQDATNTLNEMIMKELCNPSPRASEDIIKHIKNRMTYMKELKDKMTNTRVEE